MEIFGVSLPGLLSQLLLGLVNGSFYAILSLGLAVIFGLLNVINFAHGALFMLGAMFTWMAMSYFEINYWVMLVAAPLLVGVLGVLIERCFLRWIYRLDHLYGLLLTLGLALLIEGGFRSVYGVSGLGYDVPDALEGATNLGFMMLPNYRIWVVLASLAVCVATWFVIEKTRLGSYLRAGTENPRLVEAFGVNVPVMVTLTYAFGAALAALAGVLAALTTRTGVVGHMSGIRVPPGLKGRAAYAAGVRDTNPKVRLLTNFSGDQDDNALSHRIAQAQIAAGADVIFTMLNSGRDGVTRACREKRVRQIGNVIDWTAVDPQVFVASAWADVGIGAFLAVKDMKESGAPRPGINKIGLQDPAAVRLIMGKDVPASVRARVEQARAAIASGRLKVPEHYEGPEFSA